MPTNKQRRDTARRHLERQLQRRQEREARRRKVTFIASVAGALVIIAVVLVLVFTLGGNSSTPAAAPSASGSGTTSAPSTRPTTSASQAPPVSSSATQAASYPCTWTKDTTGKLAKQVSVPSTTTPPKTGTAQVAVTTTQGDMTFTLNRAEAPCTVESFVSLVQQKYYDKSPCHRLDAESLFILQCGDPTGTGEGGPGYTIPDEYKSTDKYTRGVLAMANTGQPHSGGSQFFIVYKPDQLPAQYTIFGTVTKGLGVVDKVAAKGDNGSFGQTGGGKPNLPITITSMKVTSGG